MSVARAILAIARKEIVTSFRDRQTAIYTFFLPICMYPVLFWAMVQVSLVVQGKRERTEVTVAIAGEPGDGPRPDLIEALDRDPAIVDPVTGDEDAFEVVHARAVETGADEEWAREALARRAAPSGAERDETEPDAVLLLAGGGPAEQPARLFHDRTESRSRLAERRVGQRLASHRQELRDGRARELGLDPAALDPVSLESHDLAPPEDKGALLLSFLFPMLLVVMTMFGAFFPAIDLTAGEKERGCAETTLLVPAPRWAVQQGKIVAVTVLALIAVGLNLVALALSAEGLLASMRVLEDAPIRFPARAFLAVAPLVILFAYFTSAVLVGAASLTSTFKSGQAMLGVFQMVFLLPAIAGVLPGLVLGPGLAFVPVLNVVLAFKALLIGAELPLAYGLTALALLSYAALASTLSTWLLTREESLFLPAGRSLRRVLGAIRGPGALR